jgi:glycolate oxidase iron-sulfur subunit
MAGGVKTEEAGRTTKQAALQGVFDRHDPPEMEKLLDCVHCGFCLPTCPTYLALGNEMDSPRGRVYLMRSAAEGRVGLSDSFVEHMSLCLVCRACETACPSGVDFGHLMEAARGQVARRYTRSLPDRLLRKFILDVFTSPGLLRLLVPPLRAYQQLGIQRRLRKSGLLKHLGRWGAMEGLLPELSAAASDLPEVIPAVGQNRGRVALLLGCVQRAFFPHVNRATVRVLAANGFEVVIPKGQGCCGSLLVHEGEREAGKALARKAIDVFEAAGADYVAINAAGCGSSMKDYGELLKDDPRYAARAAAFSRRVRDISEILADAGLTGRLQPLPLRVTYHDACHLVHGQRIRSGPRALLGTIPNIDLVELGEADFCCGSAGVYNLLHPEAAREVLARKLDRLAETGAQVVVSGNPGCLLQIEKGLRERGMQMRVVHTVEVLDWSYRGVAPDVT